MGRDGQRAVAGDPQVGTREQRRVGRVLDRLVHRGPGDVGEHVVAAVGEPDHDLVGLDHVDRCHVGGGDVHAVEHEIDHPVGGVDDERARCQRAADTVGARGVDRDGVPVDAHAAAGLGRSVGQGDVDGVSHVEGQVRLVDVQVRVAHLGDGGGHRGGHGNGRVGRVGRAGAAAAEGQGRGQGEAGEDGGGALVHVRPF